MTLELFRFLFIYTDEQIHLELGIIERKQEPPMLNIIIHLLFTTFISTVITSILTDLVSSLIAYFSSENNK